MIYILSIVILLMGLLFFYKKIFHLSLMMIIVWNSVLVFFLVGTNEFKIYFPETVLVVLSILGFVLFQDLLIKANRNETEVDQG